MDDIKTLKLVHLFATMDDQEIAGVRAIMRDNHFAPGQTIVHENEESGDFHVILEGEVEFLISDATGQELFLDSASKGGFFGELSMLTGEPRLVRVRATEAVRTLSFDRASFHDFLMKHPHAGIDAGQSHSRKKSIFLARKHAFFDKKRGWESAANLIISVVWRFLCQQFTPCNRPGHRCPHRPLPTPLSHR